MSAEEWGGWHGGCAAALPAETQVGHGWTGSEGVRTSGGWRLSCVGWRLVA